MKSGYEYDECLRDEVREWTLAVDASASVLLQGAARIAHAALWDVTITNPALAADVAQLFKAEDMEIVVEITVRPISQLRFIAVLPNGERRRLFTADLRETLRRLN